LRLEIREKISTFAASNIAQPVSVQKIARLRNEVNDWPSAVWPVATLGPIKNQLFNIVKWQI
jgi:hypothetical protein